MSCIRLPEYHANIAINLMCSLKCEINLIIYKQSCSFLARVKCVQNESVFSFFEYVCMRCFCIQLNPLNFVRLLLCSCLYHFASKIIDTSFVAYGNCNPRGTKNCSTARGELSACRLRGGRCFTRLTVAISI